MTYVRVRLALDRMQPGQILEVELKGDEPARNVPATVIEQGHEVVDLHAGEITRLRIRKGPSRP